MQIQGQILSLFNILTFGHRGLLCINFDYINCYFDFGYSLQFFTQGEGLTHLTAVPVLSRSQKCVRCLLSTCLVSGPKRSIEAVLA